MDSRVRGNDSGEGGDSAAKMTAAGEIPIYIGMVKIENYGGGRRKLRGGVNSAELVSPPTNVRGESGRRGFVGENRTAAGEIPIYIGMVKVGN